MAELRFYGSFLTKKGDTIKVEIFTNSTKPAEEIEFSADSPVVIEYPEVAKHDAIRGSSCNINVISAYDRQFIELYSINYKSAYIYVYKNNYRIWGGNIDTEQYEEPYESREGYEVSLTFSDFEVLKRKVYSINNSITAYFKIKDFFSYCLTETKTTWNNFEDITNLYVKFKNDYKTQTNIINSFIRTEQFNSETFYDALEKVLKSINFQLIQYNGQVIIYDINNLTKEDVEIIDWTSDSQTLSFDRTYNNIKLTFSPNSETKGIFETECYNGLEVMPQPSALNMEELVWIESNKYAYYSYPVSFAVDGLSKLQLGHTIYLSKSTFTINWESSYPFGFAFKNCPFLDGEEKEGIFFALTTWRKTNFSSGVYQASVANGIFHGDNPIMINPNEIPTSKKAESQWKSIPIPKGCVMRITMEMLLDWKMNAYEPLTQEIQSYWTSWDVYKPKTDYTYIIKGADVFRKYVTYVYIPIILMLKVGNDIYYYDNRATITQNRKWPITDKRYGIWRKNVESMCYLAYYHNESEKRKYNGETIGGEWRKNKHTINFHNEEISTWLQNSEGEIVPFPSGIDANSSEIKYKIMRYGWITGNGGDVFGNDTHTENQQKVREYVTSAFITLPTIEIVQDNVKYSEVENKDIVLNAYVDGNAREELEIDTYIGSYSDDTPLSTALFYDSEGHALEEFSRTPAIPTSWKPIEEIVLGSLFSQYAGRHIKLSGESNIDGMLTKTETHYSEKKFMMIGQSQNLIEDTADSVFVEISADNYEKN